MAEAPSSVSDEDRSPPRWLKAAPFLGKPPALTQHQWRVIGLLGIASLFDQYDLQLFSLALKQIQAELAIPEAQLGELGAIVRFLPETSGRELEEIAPERSG